MSSGAGVLIGGVVGLVGGGIAAGGFRALVVWKYGLGTKPNINLPRVPGWLAGLVERLVFMTAVYFEVSDIPTTMMAWLGLKLAANWARFDSKEKPKTHTWAMLAILCGLLSLAFAYAGGLIIRANAYELLSPAALGPIEILDSDFDDFDRVTPPR